MCEAVKAGDGDGRDTFGGSWWEDVKKSVNPIKKQNKVICNPKPATQIDSQRESPCLFLDSKSHRNAYIAHMDKNAECAISSQFPCTEEHGTISGIDSGTKTKIDRGKFKIDAIIDLHGYTQSVAYNSLVDFVIRSFERSHKCLLVITGWGRKNAGESCLRSNLHHWLQSEQIVNLILYYKQAIPAHGGKGAFYVLLRKNKQKHRYHDSYKENQ